MSMIHHFVSSVLLLVIAVALTGCAQITYNVTITGEGNTVTCTGAVDKTTDDLIDLAGSAYGDAATRQGSGK